MKKSENPNIVPDSNNNLEAKPKNRKSSKTKDAVKEEMEVKPVSEVKQKKVNAPIQVTEPSLDLKLEDIHLEDNIDEEISDNHELEELEKLADYDKAQLVEALKELVIQDDVNAIRSKVEYIKTTFYKKSKNEQEESLKNFLKENPELTETDFSPVSDPLIEQFKELLKKYRDRREKIKEAEEKERLNNLDLKRAILDELQQLIKGEETYQKTYHEFVQLQEKWRTIGMVPPQYAKQIWNDYHLHVQNFYEWIKLNNEARDVDLKKNLEAKVSICEKAEELLLENSTNKAFEKLQKLHEEWKNIGPVDTSKRDEIWNRFKTATTNIHKKRQEHYDKLQKEQENNYIAKTALCEMVEKIAALSTNRRKDLEERTKEIVDIQKKWKTIGFAPRKVNNDVWKRFRDAIDKFFEGKSEYYKKEREIFAHNLNLKRDLIVQAESLKDSTDWQNAAATFRKLQSEWRNIGPVPRKYSDKIWNEFKTACDTFYTKKNEHFASLGGEHENNLKRKNELIDKIKNINPSDNNEENLKQLKEFQKEWMEIGYVPLKEKDELNNKYKEAINNLFDSLKIESSQKEIFKYKNFVDSLVQSNDNNKIRNEIAFIEKKVTTLKSDLAVWENNIGFFSNSKNSNLLKAEIEKKIEKAKSELALFTKKMNILSRTLQTEERTR